MKFSNEEKKMWLDDWRLSGKKAWSYAKENGLIPQTFCSWVKREEKSQGGFVELPVQRIAPVQMAQEIVIEKADIRIRMPVGLSSNEYLTLMKGLRAALC
jgi:transposase-like protein